jgi:hypothetical protein
VEHGSTQNANVEKQVMGASSWSSNGAHGAYFMVTRSELGVFAFALLVLIVAGFVWAYRRKRSGQGRSNNWGGPPRRLGDG